MEIVSELERRAGVSAATTPTALVTPAAVSGAQTAEVNPAEVSFDEITPEQARAVLGDWSGFAGARSFSFQEGGPVPGVVSHLAEQQDLDRRLQENPVVGPVVGALQSWADTGSRPVRGVDSGVSRTIDTMGQTLAVPFSAALGYAPDPVRKIVDVPLGWLDEYVAEPLGDLTGSEAVRSAVNVVAPIAAGVGAAKGLGAGARGVRGAYLDRAAARVPLVDLEPVVTPRVGVAEPGVGPRAPAYGPGPRAAAASEVRTPPVEPVVTAPGSSTASPVEGPQLSRRMRTAPEPLLMDQPVRRLVEQPGSLVDLYGGRSARAPEPTLAEMLGTPRPRAPELVDLEPGVTRPAPGPVPDLAYEQPAVGAGYRNRRIDLDVPRSATPGAPEGQGVADYYQSGRTTVKRPGRGGRSEGADTPPVDLDAAESPTGAPAPSGRQGSFLRRELGEKIAGLRDYSEELHQKAQEVLSKESQRVATNVRDVQLEWGKLSKEERASMTPAIMEGRAKGTPAQETFRDFWNAEGSGRAEVLRQEFTRAGVRVVEDGTPREIGPTQRFFPMRWSKEALEKLRAQDPVFMGEVFGEMKRQGIERPQAQEILESYTDPGLRSYHAGTEMARKFKIPDKYRDPDVLGTLDDYLHGSIANAVEHEVFKYRDATGAGRNPDPMGRPQGDLGDMLAKLPADQRTGAKDLMLDVLGRNPKSSDPAHRASLKASSAIGAINALRLYGARPTTALIQQTQHAMTNALVGTRAWSQALRSIAKDPKGAYDRAIRSGAVRPHSQYADVTGQIEAGAGDALHKTTEVALTPMALSDMAARVVASESAPYFAQTLRRQLNGNAWQRRVARVNLEALDYAPAEVEVFRRGELTPEQMNTLRQRVVRRTQGEVTNATRVPFATTSVGRVFMQGKNFGVAQSRNTWRVAGKQLFQAGNPLPAAKLVVGSYLVGRGIVAAKDLIAGESKSRPDDTTTALKEGGLGGVVGDAAYAFTRDRKRLKDHLDRLDDVQFKGLLEDLGVLAYDMVSPPADRSRGFSVGGVRIDPEKDRVEIVLDHLSRMAPSANEWAKITNRVFDAADLD